MVGQYKITKYTIKGKVFKAYILIFYKIKRINMINMNVTTA